MGGDYIHVRYSEEIDKKYPYIKYTAPYRDPLYAIVTVDLEMGIMKIDGLESEFVGPAPWELGGTKESWEHISLRPAISDWSMPI
jgi:Icc protein